MARRVALSVAIALLAGSCDSGGSKASAPERTTTTTSASPSSAPGAGTTVTTTPASGHPDLAAVKVRLEKVAALQQPTAMAVRAGDDAIYVAEKGGRVRRVPAGQTNRPGTVDGQLVLDLSSDVSHGAEQGLLGLVFSPDGPKLYADFTDTKGDTQVVEFAFGDAKADSATRRAILFVHQPYPNHNGGDIGFGPDGELYVGLGDGGSEYDPDNIGQNPTTLLAKILRLDPQSAAGTRPETWVSGVRNPWRFSWDRQTGDLWIGDVGQDHWEEVDYLPAELARMGGANLGWSLMDGTHRFKGDNPPGGVLPVFEYTHDGGNCSISGGYVYRGSRIPALNGAYVYGDACSGRVWGLAQNGGKVIDHKQLTLAAANSNGYSISSFGEDAAGELYLLDLTSGLYRFEPAG